MCGNTDPAASEVHEMIDGHWQCPTVCMALLCCSADSCRSGAELLTGRAKLVGKHEVHIEGIEGSSKTVRVSV